MTLPPWVRSLRRWLGATGRRLWLRGFQVTCWVRQHRFGEREVDLQMQLPGYRNPWLAICTRCGLAQVREEDEWS